MRTQQQTMNGYRLYVNKSENDNGLVKSPDVLVTSLQQFKNAFFKHDFPEAISVHVVDKDDLQYADFLIEQKMYVPDIKVHGVNSKLRQEFTNKIQEWNKKVLNSKMVTNTQYSRHSGTPPRTIRRWITEKNSKLDTVLLKNDSRYILLPKNSNIQNNSVQNIESYNSEYNKNLVNVMDFAKLLNLKKSDSVVEKLISRNKTIYKMMYNARITNFADRSDLFEVFGSTYATQKFDKIDTFTKLLSLEHVIKKSLQEVQGLIESIKESNDARS